MLQVGSKVKYGNVSGEITSITDQIALVKLEDGKEYSVDLASLMPDESPAIKKSSLKKMDYLQDLAKDMHKAGVKELVIKDGEVTNFRADKSREEIVEEKKEEARKSYQEELRKIEEEEANKKDEGTNQKVKE